MENCFSCNFILRCHIATKFCTYHDSCCHDSTAAVPCTTFHNDHFTTTRMRAEWNFDRFWITMEKSFVKWAPFWQNVPSWKSWWLNKQVYCRCPRTWNSDMINQIKLMYWRIFCLNIFECHLFRKVCELELSNSSEIRKSILAAQSFRPLVSNRYQVSDTLCRLQDRKAVKRSVLFVWRHTDRQVHSCHSNRNFESDQDNVPHYWLFVRESIGRRWLRFTNGPYMLGFGVSLLLALTSCQNKQSCCRWFETPWRSFDHDAITWWRHQMETFSALLAICAGNSPVPGEFPAQRPVTRSFGVLLDLRLNKRLSKQS